MIGRDGSEDFLRQDPGALGDALQDGGLVEVAGALDGGTAGDGRGAACYGFGHQVVDACRGLLASISGPTLDSGSVPRAVVMSADLRGELLREVVGDGLVHDEAVGCGAGLAHVAHLREHGTFDGLVQVGVLEDHERGVAAEFHGGAQDRFGRLPEQPAAHRGGAGEGDLAEPGILDQRARDGAGGGGRDDVQDTGGQAGFLHDLRRTAGGQRGQVGGLEHHGAAGGDGGGNLAGGHGQREVPRGDQQARAHRLLRAPAGGSCRQGRRSSGRTRGRLPRRTSAGTRHRR